MAKQNGSVIGLGWSSVCDSLPSGSSEGAVVGVSAEIWLRKQRKGRGLSVGIRKPPHKIYLSIISFMLYSSSKKLMMVYIDDT